MFSKQMHNFTQTLSGLRSFVNLVGPFLDSKTKELPKRHVKNLAPLVLVFAKMYPDIFKEAGFSKDRIRRSFDGKIDVKRDREGLSLRVTGPQAKAFHDAMTEIEQGRQRIHLLYQSSLISLISAVECFLSQIIYAYFDCVPNAISDKDKYFSFDDLKSFGRVQDARTYYIEKSVADLMRASFAGWVDFFKTKPKLSMSYLEPYMDILVETFERRNLLVHNGGIINSIYLSKVAPSLRKGKRKGMQIGLTREYLDERIDYFEKHSLLIAAELWKVLKPKAEARSKMLMSITYEHLKAKRWSIAEGLGYFQIQDKQMPEPARLVGTLNYWLSMKRQNKWVEVRSAVEQEDFSAKGLRFQLAHLSLLEKKDLFFQAAPRALKSEAITEDELREFPIFEEMRTDKRFSKYKEKAERSSKRRKRTRKKSAMKKTMAKKATAKRSARRTVRRKRPQTSKVKGHQR